jgi:hypothetical protein
VDTDVAFKLAELRGQIAELGSSIRQLQKAGMDSASAQLLIARKRGELERLMNSDGATTTPPARRGYKRSPSSGARGMLWECDPSCERRVGAVSAI